MRRNDRHCVAIVDDDAGVLASAAFLLKLEGFDVRAYASAAAFLADSVSRNGCLILDHHMPDMTGLELVARLRQAGVLIPVVLLTGAPSDAICARAAALGVETVMAKPPRDDALLEFAHRHID